MSAGRPSGLTPWRIVRTQSTRLVGARPPTRRRRDVGRAHEHALAVVDDDVAAAVGAVAVAAAARREQVAPALDAGGVAAQRHRRDGDVDAALQLALAELRPADEGGAGGGDDQRRSADQARA